MSAQSYLKRLLGRRTIADELVAACAQLPEIKKLGLNQEDPEDPYNYLRIADLCESLRQRLFRRGILFVPSDLEQLSEWITNRKGEPVEKCTVKTQFTVIRRKERLELGISMGTAENRGDKALAVAQTAAYKAWLKRLTMVYGKHDDPEYSDRQGETPRQAVRHASFQRRSWNTAVRDSGLTTDQISAQLSEIMHFPINAEEIPDLPEEDFENCMKWLLRHQDLSAEWSKAVEQAKVKRGPQPVVTSIDHTDPKEFAGD